MALSLRLLRYFVTAAETGSTTAAARHLNVSQPSISVAIRELEALFDAPLFTRDAGTGMTLTQFGQRKLDEARHLLASASAFITDDVGEGNGGLVQIGVFRTIAPVYLPRVLKLAQARFPALTVHFREGDLTQLDEWLHKRQIDLALMYDVGLPIDIERECLAELKPYALVPSETPLAKRRRAISLHELAAQPFIQIDLPQSRDFLMAPFWQHGLAPNVRYRATSIELVRAMVASGLGVSLLITQSPAVAQTPLVAERPIREATVIQPLVIARPARVPYTRASELLATCVRDAVAEAMGERVGK
ncbi:LysR family transcriptional regulator [Paraburkholderia fungorum]|jgi:DNA-binding transcriptional LysR family regulator|uniref:LysR family transcriptional regulator n=1 Tax=Paraburkholderia fungorum TaxID=134537 RepID=UPI000DB785B2|nr:LysR family transcriptional regulator [Paraburkholderia fungorum]PZR51153.1 MAG: LysR family transcriptional regulator [Paraburkholderia fungorum]QLD52518.1 LysR family transcriptional regulator [Paraburkholderia fungorum]